MSNQPSGEGCRLGLRRDHKVRSIVCRARGEMGRGGSGVCLRRELFPVRVSRDKALSAARRDKKQLVLYLSGGREAAVRLSIHQDGCQLSCLFFLLQRWCSTGRKSSH